MNGKVLNNLPRDIFSYTSANNEQIKVCAASGATHTLDRNKIISCGRIAAAEYLGKCVNADANNPFKYNSKVDDYATFSRNTWVDTVLFCAAQANRAIGKEPYSTMDEVAKDRGLYRDRTFWRALQTITEEVIYPLLPAYMDAPTDRIISWTKGRLGETKLIDIESNDFFLYEDDSWGSVSSKPEQYLYKSQIALTPKPYTAKASIKWYQDVIDGEAGRYYSAFARGAINKMFATTVEKFKSAITNTKYLPSGNILEGYTPEHWNEAVMKASALNGVRRTELMALGTLAGLSQVLPTVGTSGAVAGIQGEIGVEYVRNGFLGNVAGVDLVEVGLAVVPGTQNYDPQFISLDDPTQENIYIVAKVGYAPMVGVIAEGSPITIEFTPTESADMKVHISETIICDIAPAFSSKIFQIKA